MGNLFSILETWQDKQLTMVFRDNFEESNWDLEWTTSAILYVLMCNLFPEEAVTEKYLQENLSDLSVDKNVKKKLSLDITKNK